MKIIHVTEVRDRSNGIVSVVRALSSAQTKAGHSSIVINIRDQAEDIEGICRILSKEAFKEIITQFYPDIVIFHGLFYTKIRSYSSVVFNNGIPFLLEPHGAYSQINYKKTNLRSKYLDCSSLMM